MNNNLGYQVQNAKDFMSKVHSQAYADHVTRRLQPSFRERLATLLTKVAIRLERNTQAEGTQFAPVSKSAK